jgi:hypothetical protein
VTRRNALFLIPALLFAAGFVATCITPLSFQYKSWGDGCQYKSWGVVSSGASMLIPLASFAGLWIFALATTNGPWERARKKGKETEESGGWHHLQSLLIVPAWLNYSLSMQLPLIAEIKHHIPLDRNDHISFFLLPFWAGIGILDLTGMSPFSRKLQRALNDELSRVHRSAALQSGFCVAVLGCCAAYMAILFRPESAAYTLPMILVASISTASLHFAWAEWRADG